MRRDELYDSSSDAGSRSHVDAEEDAEVRAKLNERLSSLLGLDLSASAPTFEHKESERPGDKPLRVRRQQQAQEEGDDDDDDEKKEGEEEFEFRLFSTSSKSAAPAKVILAASDDEDAPQGEGAFIVPARPASYYVAGAPTPEQLERYRWAAVAGEDIILGARKRAWGLERPWRVIRLTVPPKSLAGLLPAQALPLVHPSDGGEPAVAKRKRPGKKRRIATRIKAKAEKEKREAEDKNKMTKEEHLKEKKKRLNRERKLKRRAKEKEKKLATKGEAGAQSVSEAGASETDDDTA